MSHRNDIDVKELEQMFAPFEGEYSVSVDCHDQVFVEDSNGLTVCHFNRLTQLPMTDANMEWEKNYWVDRAYQICDALNRDYYKK